jgi:hypothetical protein
MQMKCPGCYRGQLDERRICQRCGIGVPLSILWDQDCRVENGRRPVRVHHAYYFHQTTPGDYARTKEDKK